MPDSDTLDTQSPADTHKLGLNPRYANYCRAHNTSPRDQHALDAPEGGMFRFVLWNKARLREAREEIPQAFTFEHLHDHAAYDAWLTQWVDRKLEEAKGA